MRAFMPSEQMTGGLSMLRRMFSAVAAGRWYLMVSLAGERIVYYTIRYSSWSWSSHDSKVIVKSNKRWTIKVLGSALSNTGSGVYYGR